MKITIELTPDNHLHYQTDEPISFPQALNMTLSALLQHMEFLLKENPEAKEQIFDLTNEAFSECLARFAPDIDMRTDFDHDAILEHSTIRALKHVTTQSKS